MYNAIYDTLIIAKKVIYLPSCHSTNDIAAEIVREISFEEGTVVITDDQTKGRGQRGSVWLTEPGQNLTMSIILRPVFLPIQDQFLISKAISVGIWSYLNTYATEISIKWPNDIYLADKKICGTLIESSIQGTQISSSVVGIGLNINQQTFANPKATSLAANQNNNFLLREEFQKLVRHLDSAYFKLKSEKGRDEISSTYLSQLYGFQKLRKFKIEDKIICGRITGISPSGMLRIRFENSDEIREFNNKEVEWLWED